MPSIKVNIKWSGKKYELELDTDESPLVFKIQVFTLTGVAPERQKILVKGGQLKDDTDLNKLDLKEGHTFMLMGTAGELPKAPEKPMLFVEDMTDTQLAEALQLPAGLQNLGNTCYMNATLQCLRNMPELQDSLNRYPGGIRGMDDSGNLTASLRDLFKQLGKTTEGFPPLVFLQMLRQTFPQFAQAGPGSVPAQQDAEECWSQVVSVLKAKLPPLEGSEKGFVDKYMTGEIVNTLKCVENEAEEVTVDKEPFTKLDCHISIATNYMQNGILDALKQDITKNSPTLNRTAVYLKTSRVSRLPQYLTVHFIRFFWKASERVRAKIMRKVKFPLEFDASELCTPELQQQTMRARNKLQEIANERAIKKRAAAKKRSDAQTETQSAAGPATEAASVTDTVMDVDAPEEKVDWTQFVDPELAKDVGANISAQYELCAVLTHVGRSADSGHYIGWAKKGEDEWVKYDDDKVSIVRDEDVQKLDGGGDWHMAYICLYRAKKLE